MLQIFSPVTSLVILFILMVLRSEKKNRPMINEFTAKIFSCFPVELSINVQNNCICVSYFSVGKLFFFSVFGISLIKRYPTHKPISGCAHFEQSSKIQTFYSSVLGFIECVWNIPLNQLEMNAQLIKNTFIVILYFCSIIAGTGCSIWM